MLGKLMKYEFKATARFLIPAYIAVFVFALINKVILELDFFDILNGLPAAFAMIGYILVIISTFMLTYIVMIQRFYKNLLGDEGYLMFTLPVKSHSLILSKLIVSVIWMIISFVVTVVSVLILVSSREFYDSALVIFKEMYDSFINEVGANGVLFIVELAFSTFVSTVGGILMIYASIAIGQLIKNHKVIGSFGAYLALNFASQMIFTVIYFVAVLSAGADFAENMESTAAMHLLLGGSTLFNAVLAAAYYIITQQLLSKKLNLE